MSKKITLLLTALLCSTISFAQQKNTDDYWLQHANEVVHEQLSKAASFYKPGLDPRSVKSDGTVKLAPLPDWTTGFFPGSLWLGYELSGDQLLAKKARSFTLALDSARYLTNTHDVGFIIYTSYGNAYRITHDKVYLPVLSDGSKHLYARFNPKIGVIRSWDFPEWHYPVIIDNMMNLEYLYWAAAALHMPAYDAAASTHATTTQKNHYRPDYSSYHVVDYDPATGKVLKRATHQGLTDESSWSRGQAWGLYGFTMCYRHTHDPKFLAQAEHIAAFLMNHPRMPEDKVPAWDFDVHNALEKDLPAIKDASAAAIMASALLELSTYEKNPQPFVDYAEAILKTLSSDSYLAKPGENHFFILKHSVGAFLYDSEIDTPIDYADYYYIEALKRYRDIRHISKETK
jgi:unsaturated chondroitin disaccharide hydrolase